MTARTKSITISLLALTLGLAACAPSPLYVRTDRLGTFGEIPRDGRGEPLWQAIPTTPGVTPSAPREPAAGIPIIPPRD